MEPTARMLAPRFPEDFRMGVADADLQVIGEDSCLREEQSQPTMWGHFARDSGKVFKNETPGRGADRFHRWEEDADLISSLGFAHYRTSISWSRLLKEDDSVNEKACEWYRNYFAKLRSNGIKIYATLYHWELPYRYHEMGGWKHRGTADGFIKHAEAVVEHLGEFIEEYFILNEPWCSAHNSYYTGTHAPGESNLRDTLIAAHHLLIAQAQAFERMKAIAPDAKIGTVVNIEPSFADSESEEDKKAAKVAHQFFNGWFLDPLFHGYYPEEIQSVYGSSMPDFPAADLDAIKIGAHLSALGINYYQSKFVRSVPESPLAYEGIRRPGEEENGLGWSVFVPPVYPPGLLLGLRMLEEDYADAGLPQIYITENGYAGTDDASRLRYYMNHLVQVVDAVDEGLNVTAYFAWTLLDNYEWAEGYRPESRFGIVSVDPSFERTVKGSGDWFRELNGLLKT